MVRCYCEFNFVHVNVAPSPRQDIEIIQVELALVDIAQIEWKRYQFQSAINGEHTKFLALSEAVLPPELLVWSIPIMSEDLFGQK